MLRETTLEYPLHALETTWFQMTRSKHISSKHYEFQISILLSLNTELCLIIILFTVLMINHKLVVDTLKKPNKNIKKKNITVDALIN